MSDKDKKNQAQPQSDLPKRPIGQTILVILLIAAVAIIFGIGPGSLNMALGGKQVRELADGITNIDVARYQRVDTVLKALQIGQKPHEMSDKEWTQLEGQLPYFFREPPAGYVLMQSRLAESDGMLPSGEALDLIVKEFLVRKMPSGVSMFTAIKEVQEGATTVERSFSKMELREYLAIKRSNENYDSRYNPSLVAIDSMGDIFYSKSKERIYTQEARLSTAAILPEFKEIVAKDQELLTATYENYKSLKRFEIPRKAHLTVLGADSTVIAASVVISDEAIGAWYIENKETDTNIRIVTEPALEKDADSKKDAEKSVKKADEKESAKEVAQVEPIITYKTLDDSKAYIRSKLESETSAQILTELCEKVVETIQESDLLDNYSLIEGKEAEMIALVQSVNIPASDERLTADVHFTVWTEVTGDDPGVDNDVQLFDKNAAPLARLGQAGPLYLFNGKRGNIGFPQAASDHPRLKLMVITDAIDPASDKELEAVKDEVIMLAAVKKAYVELVKRGEALQRELNEEANRDLNVFFAAAEHAHWSAEVADKEYAALDVITPPENAQNDDELPIIAYTQVGKQYVLATDSDDGEMKRVRLVKIIRHEIKEDLEKDLRSSRGLYIRAVGQVSYKVFGDESKKSRN